MFLIIWLQVCYWFADSLWLVDFKVSGLDFHGQVFISKISNSFFFCLLLYFLLLFHISYKFLMWIISSFITLSTLKHVAFLNLSQKLIFVCVGKRICVLITDFVGFLLFSTSLHPSMYTDLAFFNSLYLEPQRPKIWRWWSIISVVFLPRGHNPNLIMRKHQTSINWEICKIPGLCSLGILMSLKPI